MRRSFIVLLILCGCSAGPSAEQSTPEFSDTPPTKYVVKGGDTLMSICRKFYGDDTKWGGLAEANKDLLPDPNQLSAGQLLRIPVASELKSTPVPAEAPEKLELPTEYEVQLGDTLSSIARKFYGDDNWEPIAEANRLESPNHIRSGQTLTIPKLPDDSGVPVEDSSEEAPEALSPPTTHSVRPGERLQDIASLYYRCPELAYLIAEANPNAAKNGQVAADIELFIPGLTAYMPLH